jgi:succinate dehydrogenase / fumarate reductase flavoprotein subunit
MLLASTGKRSPDSFHRELGLLMWEQCGMTRSDKGLRQALGRIPELRQQLAEDLRVVGGETELNQELERALRVTDLFELAELLVRDALHRTESCGGHFREESQTAEGEAQRDDQRFGYVAAWEHRGDDAEPALHREPLEFEHCMPAQRSYK